MLDGYVFAVGGWEGRSRLDSVECYNPQTNTWQFMESVKMAVTSPAVVALDGLLYVTGNRFAPDSVVESLIPEYSRLNTTVWTACGLMLFTTENNVNIDYKYLYKFFDIK